MCNDCCGRKGGFTTGIIIGVLLIIIALAVNVLEYETDSLCDYWCGWKSARARCCFFGCSSATANYDSDNGSYDAGRAWMGLNIIGLIIIGLSFFSFTSQKSLSGDVNKKIHYYLRYCFMVGAAFVILACISWAGGKNCIPGINTNLATSFYMAIIGGILILLLGFFMSQNKGLFEDVKPVTSTVVVTNTGVPVTTVNTVGTNMPYQQPVQTVVYTQQPMVQQTQMVPQQQQMYTGNTQQPIVYPQQPMVQQQQVYTTNTQQPVVYANPNVTVVN